MSIKLIGTLKESILFFKNNKKRSFILFGLQLLFFAAMLPTAIHFITNIVESTQNIIEYSESLNVGVNRADLDIIQQKLPLGDDPLLISRNYNDIKKSLLLMAISFSLIHFVIFGVMWYFILTKKTFRIEKKEIKKLFAPMLIFSFVFYGLIYLLFFSISGTYFSDILFTNERMFLIFTIITLIVFFVVLPVVPFSQSSRSKNLLKDLFVFVKKNFFGLLVAYFVMLFFLFFSLFLIYFFIEKNFFLLSLSIVFSILVFVWSKVYLNETVKNLGGF